MTAFPQAPLGQACDLNLGGAWTPITGYAVQQAAGQDTGKAAVSIGRGRADETTTQASPSTAAFRLNNGDGRFTARNPTGPYYPDLTRNTPCRWSVPAAGVSLRIEDDKSGYITAPDSAGLSITGDTEIQVEAKLTDYQSCNLAQKWTGGTQQSWIITLNTDGSLTFFWSATGSNTLSARSTMPLPLGRVALKVTLDVNNGSGGNTVTFYTAPTIASGAWAQLGAAVTQSGTTSVFDSTSAVSVGVICSGRFYGFRLLNGIGGATVASPDFTAATAGAASMTDGQGNVWSVAGTAEFSGRDYRFHGELSALPAEWDITGHDIWVPVTASGVLRRMQQGQQPPVDSALKRALQAKSGNLALHAYWPCEDAAGATQLGSGIGGPPMRFSGTQRPQLASDSAFACSQPIPLLNKSEWDGQVPPYTSHGSIVVRFLLDIPASPAAADDGPNLVTVQTTGTAKNLFLHYRATGALQLTGWDGEGTQLFDTGNVTFGVNGQPVWCSLEVQLVAGNVQYSITTLQPGASTGLTFAVHITGGTVGNARNVLTNITNAISDIAIGQIGVQSQWESLFDDFSPLFAWQGEAAGNRFIRLCGENGLTGRVYGYPAVSVAMGAQVPDSLVNLLQQCEDADRGQIYEPRQVLGLAYRTSASLTNQVPIALDYAQGHISPPLSPTDDDQYTVNDVTVTNTGGTTYRTTLDSGPLSTQPPPAGAGDYANSYDLPVASDSQLPDEAGWILRTGTVDEERYPQVVVNLASTDPRMTAVAASVKAADIGDHITISNPPAFLPPAAIKQLVWGSQEDLGDYCYKITWNCVPESPWEVGVAADAIAGRVDTAGSSLHSPATSGATSLSVDTTDTYLWTTTGADDPFDVIIGGERITVTSITGASSPQTWTVTRAVNGVVKAHSAGEAVALFRPAVVALTG